MRILTTLTYYRPHYSGLTIYAERLARVLAARGHHVTVLTSRFDQGLPRHEIRDGVEVMRLPVLMRISKGVIMPAMAIRAMQLARQADIVHLHLPQLDASYLALIARSLGKPVILTYQCDLRLPSGAIHRVANLVSHLANHVSARAANGIVSTSRDYAEHSDFLRGYLDKVHVISPPIVLSEPSAEDIEAFRCRAQIKPGQRIIGMAARLASEKGVEYLVEAMPSVLREHPSARVLFMGQYQNVLGEEAYAKKLAPLIEKLGMHWTFLGNLSPTELAVFYRECEVTVLPSINSTEAFGMVQVEAMTCGTPVVATDLPGVRQPVRMTGMGLVVPPMDAHALARAIINVLDHPENFRGDPQAVKQQFSPETIGEEYEQLFRRLLGK
jgi:glycosyltransferase involved in cell wall biosynthesis